nr:MmcQ/YjbR family DNA-binding protein [Bacteroidaceae bacterium]
LTPETAIELRERYDGVRPAYHMNKKHWSDLYLNELDESFIKEQIRAS